MGEWNKKVVQKSNWCFLLIFPSSSGSFKTSHQRYLPTTMRVNSKPFFTDFRCTWFGKFANPTYPGVSGFVNCPCWSQKNRTIYEQAHLKSRTKQISKILSNVIKFWTSPVHQSPHKTETLCNIHPSALISLPWVFQLETFWARTKPAKIIFFWNQAYLQNGCNQITWENKFRC